MNAGQRFVVTRFVAGAMTLTLRAFLLATVAALCAGAGPFSTGTVAAQSHYDPGASDTEIRIGNVMPHTGAFAEYGVVADAEAAYFRMINDQGGINGRKIVYLSLDSQSNPQTGIELVHKLIEQDHVLLLVSTFGTPVNIAIRPYMNSQRIPQLFVTSPAAIFDDPAHYPYTMGFEASRHTEALVYAKYILRNKPDAKIGVLYGNDESGRESVVGLREGLGDKAATMIVKEEMFSYGDAASIGPHVAALKNAGADVFMNLLVGRYATEAIRQAYDMDWHPLQFLANASLSISAFLDPAGAEKTNGIITNARSKGWTTPGEQKDPAVRAFLDWMKQYNPDANLRDANNVYGYEVAQTLVEVLKKAGNDLTRENVMKQAASLDFDLGMLRPGIRVTTSATDYRPIKQLYLIRFDGHNWVSIGNISSE